MITISVRLDEKRSTTSQYENKTVGVLLEAQHLEISSRDDILQKTRELFALAKAAVNQQFHDPGPAQDVTAPENGAPRGNGTDRNGGTNGNGRRRSYGRPDPEPTPKQRTLLRKIARDRNLGPESIREIAERIVGKRIEEMDRRDVSRLIEALLEGEAA